MKHFIFISKLSKRFCHSKCARFDYVETALFSYMIGRIHERTNVIARRNRALIVADSF